MKAKGIIDGEKLPNVVTLPLAELLKMLAEAREEGRRSVQSPAPWVSPAPAPWQAPIITVSKGDTTGGHTSKTWIYESDGTEPSPQISRC